MSICHWSTRTSCLIRQLLSYWWWNHILASLLGHFPRVFSASAFWIHLISWPLGRPREDGNHLAHQPPGVGGGPAPVSHLSYLPQPPDIFLTWLCSWSCPWSTSANCIVANDYSFWRKLQQHLLGAGAGEGAAHELWYPCCLVRTLTQQHPERREQTPWWDEEEH